MGAVKDITGQEPGAIVIGHAKDMFAADLAAALTYHGVEACHLDYMAAAQLLTITIDSIRTKVSPTCPLVIRSPAHDSVNCSDARFHFGECVSTVWAAAALTEATVVGRPSAMGFGGRCTPSGLVTERRGGIFNGRPEVFLSGVWGSSQSGELRHSHNLLAAVTTL